MADLETKRLRMISWNRDLALAAMDSAAGLSGLLGIDVPHGFPNEPVKNGVLPRTLQELEYDPGYGQWSGIIVHVTDAIVIGSMGFKSPPDEHGTVEIGYDIIAKYQGQGYATEMARSLIEWGFRHAGVRQVTAECLIGNRPSIRVLEKIGMSRVAETEDRIRWQLSKP